MDDTTNWIKEISRDDTKLNVQLVKAEKLDVELFDRMANDDFCVHSVLRNKEKGSIMYSIKDLVTLDDFLKQYVFVKEEIYIFLEHLFEQAIASNRNKPILLLPNYIFLNMHGDTFYFVALPITVDEWMFQKDRIVEWIQYLANNIQTKTAFECIGYLMRFCQAEEFSLPNLILGLKNLRKKYYPDRFSFFHRTKTTFSVKEPIYPLYPVAPQQEKQAVRNETTVLSLEEKYAYLEGETNQFELVQEIIQIGRSNTNDIVLSQKEVSSNHARITRVDTRYYIQDLKSSNGTFINEKKVQRKMRLKEGMIVRFANVSFIFHEMT